ncbi:MAG: hypothetical protein ACLTTH_15470 [Holdemanella porci]
MVLLLSLSHYGVLPYPLSFTIIYTLLLFFYIKKKTQEIQTDYNTLLDSIKNIISEDFDTITEKILGYLNQVKKNLINLV